MQYSRTRNKRHIEDNFDLEEYKKNSVRQRYEKSFAKNKIVLNLITALILFLSFVLAILIFILGNYYLNLFRNKSISKQVTDFVTETSLETDLISSNSDLFAIDNGDNIIANIENVNENIINVPSDKPKTIINTFAKERADFGNNDILGFLKIEGTNIANFIVQTTDNSYYLERSLYKEKNKAGSVFMDHENTSDELDDNTILYGHNMRDGSMFHNIRFYIENNSENYYYETHKYITFQTMYENTKWEIFSFYPTSIQFNYLEVNYPTEELHQEFLDQILAKSIHDTKISVTPEDKILTLSTCTNTNDDMRFVVHAKLIESTSK